MLTLLMLAGMVTGDITGALDGVSPPGAATSAVGWAKDTANLSASVRLQFFLGAGPPKGVLLGGMNTSSPRPDLGLPGLHGFSFAIPDKYLDKKNHSVLAFGVRSDGSLAPVRMQQAMLARACRNLISGGFPDMLLASSAEPLRCRQERHILLWTRGLPDPADLFQRGRRQHAGNRRRRVRVPAQG